MSCECDCEPVEVLITSLGPQDDDLRVRVNNTVAFDGRMNVGWYSGEGGVYGAAGFNPLWATSGFRVVRLTREVMHALGCRVLPGAVISVDVFDGWAGSWLTSPWRAEIFWNTGEISTFTGGSGTTGASVLGMPTMVLIPLVEHFPLKTDVPDFGRYGAKIFGPYPFDSSIVSHADSPAWFDDDMVLNGEVVYPTGVADLVNGGVTTTLLSLPAGQTFSVDVQNSYGWCWAQNSLRVVPDTSNYFASGPHFETYIENGSFVVPCPPTSQPSAGVLVTPYG